MPTPDPTTPYANPTVNELQAHHPQRQVLLHVGLCFSMIALWITTFVVAILPNNVLHSYGLGNAVALDLGLGIPFAFVVATISLSKRRSCPNLPLLIITQVLAWAHSIGLITLFAIAIIIAIQVGA